MNKSPRYAALFFDLDGTLVDSLTSILLAVNATLADYALPLLSREAMPAIIGDGARMLVERMFFLSTGQKLGEDALDAACVVYRQHFARTATEGIVPFDGIPELLRDLKAAGTALYVFSNKPHPQAVDVAQNAFPGIFSEVFGQRPEFPRKPDPAQILWQMAKTKQSPATTCMVGDGDTDILAGQRAGIDQVACLWGYRPSDALLALKPTFAVQNVAALRSVLLADA